MKGPEGFALFINIAMNVILGILLTICVDLSIQWRLGIEFMTPEIVIGTDAPIVVNRAIGPVLPRVRRGMIGRPP